VAADVDLEVDVRAVAVVRASLTLPVICIDRPLVKR
jgi:hypothetical protein